MSLARQLLLQQAAIILVAFLIAAGAALYDARADAQAAARNKVLGIAEAVARAPVVVAALESGEPPSQSSSVQGYAEAVRRGSDTDFVVVMRPDRTRLSHPTESELGRHFIGNIAAARDGRSFTETYTGTLGRSVRAVVPVWSEAGVIVGMVSVGILLESIGEEFLGQLPAIVGVALAVFGVAAAGTYVVSRRLRRQTHGMGPDEMTRMYEYWDAVLHSVREGLLVFDNDLRLQFANDEAKRLLGLPEVAAGQPLEEVPFTATLRELVQAGREAVDELHVVAVHTLVVNQRPAVWEGHKLGTVLTFRDHTDLTTLTGELDSVRGFAEALHAQAHEAANKLHTVIALAQLDKIDEAVQFATAELEVTQQLTDRVMGAVAEPVLSALLLGKASQASERGVEFVVTDDTHVEHTTVDPRDLVTAVGNLIDNALEAALSGSPPHRVMVSAHHEGGTLVIQVSDTGPGLESDELEAALQRGWTTKGDDGAGRGLGLALVYQVVQRYHGSLTLTRDVGAVFVLRIPEPGEPGTTALAGTEDVR